MQELAAGERLCGACRMEEPPFARAVAYGSYSDGLRELIQLLKYQGVRPAAGVLGRMLVEALLELSEDFGDVAPVVVPVPLHASKLRQRGFNQSELIARAALKNFRMRGTERLALEPSLLERVRETQSQTGLSAEQRRAKAAYRDVSKGLAALDKLATAARRSAVAAAKKVRRPRGARARGRRRQGRRRGQGTEGSALTLVPAKTCPGLDPAPAPDSGPEPDAHW